MIDIDKVKFDEKGLVPAVVQEANGKVLMLAYMNKESLQKLQKQDIHGFIVVLVKNFGIKEQLLAINNLSVKFIMIVMVILYW